MKTRPPHVVDELYPYDPAERGREAYHEGLDKLRCYEDRELAAKAYDVAQNVAEAERERVRRQPPQQEFGWSDRPAPADLPEDTSDRKFP